MVWRRPLVPDASPKAAWLSRLSLRVHYVGRMLRPLAFLHQLPSQRCRVVFVETAYARGARQQGSAQSKGRAGFGAGGEAWS